MTELDKTLWIGCNDESVGVYTVDLLDKNTICDGNSINVYYVSFNARCNEQPKDVEQWLPLLEEAIAFTVDQQLKLTRMALFSFLLYGYLTLSAKR